MRDRIEDKADQSMLEHGFSFDFLDLCDPSWVVRQLRNWVRFSDIDDLRDYLKTMNRLSMDGWSRRRDSTMLRSSLHLSVMLEGYWSFARSLIPREIGGNEYIDVHGDANFALPELPPQLMSGTHKKGILFRDTLKAVYSDGQDGPDSYLISTKFDRSCSDNVGFDVFNGAKEL